MIQNFKNILLLFLFIFYSNPVISQCWFSKLTSDLNNGTAEFKNFIKNGDDAYDSYRIIYNARGANSVMKTDVALLNKIAELKADATFMQRIGNEDGLEKIIKANVSAPCKSCGNAGSNYLNHIDDYLNDVKDFTNRYYNIPGFDNVIKDIKVINGTGSPSSTVEGSAFMLRVLRDNESVFAGKITKFEGSIDDLENGCRYDVLFNNGTKTTFGEFKSWGPSSISNFLKIGGSSYKQFSTYIGKINSLDELRYYFDINKLSDINIIRNRFRSIFEVNAQDIFNKNTKIFNTINITPTSKIDSWQKLEAVAKDKELFNSLIANKIVKLE